MVKYLLDMGGDPSCCTNSGLTPLHFAAKKGFIEIIELLAEYDIDLDKQDDYGRTPMHFAAAYGKVKSAEALYKLGANPNPFDYEVSFHFLKFFIHF